MKKIHFCVQGASLALTHARYHLQDWGYEVSSAPNPAVTHVLLPIPSMDEHGAIRGGPTWEQLFPQLPENVTILGGNLPPLPCRTVDFLQDAYSTAENAAITAHCAVGIVMSQLPRTLPNTNTLVIGWGRIGKCLAELLRSLGTTVTVAARKESDLAMLEALGFSTMPLPLSQAQGFDVILNTVPAPVLQADQANANALLIDLASHPGILGDGVLWERGLPGRSAPETSGILIAKTALRYALGKE